MPYEKTADLLDLAVMMQSNREGVSLKDICSTFNVSRRTAERMRDLIIEKFPQAVENIGEKNVKRWYIPQGTLRDFTQFSAEEISLLESAKQLFDRNGMTDKLKTLDQLTNKIKANIKTDVMRRLEPDVEALMEAEGFIYRPGPKLKIDIGIIADIRQAILENHQIRITYFSRFTKKNSCLTLLPFGLLYGERTHYLVAKHSDGYANGEPRTFILSNIEKVEILDIPYDYENFSLQKYAAEAFGAFHEKPFDVEWLFDAEVAEDAKKYMFHPSQKMVENKDGTVTVSFRAGGRLEMDWHLYTWGNHVKVIKPADWKKPVI